MDAILPGPRCGANLFGGINGRTVGRKEHGALLLKTYSHVRVDHEREMVAKVCFGMPAPPSAAALAAA